MQVESIVSHSEALTDRLSDLPVYEMGFSTLTLDMRHVERVLKWRQEIIEFKCLFKLNFKDCTEIPEEVWSNCLQRK